MHCGYRPESSIHADETARIDPVVPRAFSLGLSRPNFPPPPCAEDEAESLAREHGSSVVESSDDEPKHRGDVEQQPILLPVPEFNPERRFVLVPTDGDGSNSSSTTSATGHNTREKDANDCKKYIHVPKEDEKNSKDGGKPGLERRKSRQDLPQIDTGVQEHHRPSGMHRSKSATYINRGDGGPERHSNSQPAADDGLLSPLIMHSTKGRDRAYWDYSSGSNKTPARDRSQDPRASPRPEKDRGDGYRATHSLDPPFHKRSNSTTESPKLSRRASERDRYREVSSSSRRASALPPGRRNPSPPRSDRGSNSPPRRQSTRDRESFSGRPSGYKARRGSPPREEDEYFGDNRGKGARSNNDGRNVLLSPDSVRSPTSRGMRSPLPSPRIVQSQFPSSDRVPSPRSATFPKDDKRFDSGAVTPPSPGSSPPRSGLRADDGDQPARPQNHARSTSINPALAATAAAAVPVVASALMPDPAEAISGAERRSPLPSPSYAREDPLESSRSGPPGKHASWDMPIVSYRQYLSDVQQGLVRPLPACRRKKPQAGHLDWLTLPRSVNFDICPDCYESVFTETSFKHSFVPAPFHGADKPVSCDFGSSPWYKIAWLRTLKYGIKDLHLLQGIAAVVSKGQQCPGNQPSIGVWYSILDPHNRRPIPDFTVCYHCAKTAEVILPNMTGIFLPLDPQGGPSAGVCAMHYAPGRKRFVDIYDHLETVSDRALSRGSPPDFQKLANSIRELSLMPECMREEQVRDGKWFTMERIPDLTVCEECFDQVVWPYVEADEKGGVARKFFQRAQRLPVAACQLYSDRMREVFRKACRRNDLKYLEDKVRERLDIEAAIKAKLAENLTEDEARELVRKWEEWE